MIRLIEAKNYRCLRYVRQTLTDFQILVGPNASGKTTFLDVIGFLSDVLSQGLDEAILERTSNFQDLLFQQRGNRFQLAVELEIPEERAQMLPDKGFNRARYEIDIGLQEELEEVHIFDEQVILLQKTPEKPRQRTLFPHLDNVPDSIMSGKSVRKGRRIVRKVYDGNDNFYSELQTKRGKGGWAPSFRLGPRKSALANMPEDERSFPVSTWLRETLTTGTQRLMLNSMALRRSSRPGQGKAFLPDGSNLPWVVQDLADDDEERLKEWVAHLRTALPDLENIDTVELPDTRHRYLRLHYDGGLAVPSWMASDGTLRMLALTLPAYLADFEGVYLIEEPENGIHPMAMETVYQALRSTYGAQILTATHSPVVLGCAEPADVLCFKKDEQGATDIVSGSEHPGLRNWQGEVSLSVLYASGVLG